MFSDRDLDNSEEGQLVLEKHSDVNVVIRVICDISVDVGFHPEVILSRVTISLLLDVYCSY